MKPSPSRGVSAVKEALVQIQEQIKTAVILRDFEEEIGHRRSERQTAEWLEKKYGIRHLNTREGRIDFILKPILADHVVFDIHEVPFVLSDIGMLITSDTIVAVEQVMQHYREKVDSNYNGSIDYQLMSGYRPQVDLICRLPRCYYQHPGYVAPVEDLMDSLAVRFYAAKRTGDAEDGAVGWLVNRIFKHVQHTTEEELLAQLSKGLKFWNSSRLQQCLVTWRKVVGPTLLPHEFATTSN